MNQGRSIRRAAMLVAGGLLVQTGAALHWTPGAFVIAAAVGVPLVLIGGGVFVAVVLRTLKNKDAL